MKPWQIITPFLQITQEPPDRSAKVDAKDKRKENQFLEESAPETDDTEIETCLEQFFDKNITPLSRCIIGNGENFYIPGVKWWKLFHFTTFPPGSVMWSMLNDLVGGQLGLVGWFCQASCDLVAKSVDRCQVISPHLKQQDVSIVSFCFILFHGWFRLSLQQKKVSNENISSIRQLHFVDVVHGNFGKPDASANLQGATTWCESVRKKSPSLC